MKSASNLRELNQNAIYQIINTTNNKCYIGSTERLALRFNEHISLLRRGQHHSVKLQRTWDKHNADVFQFLVLEHPAAHCLVDREQYYLDTVLFASCNDQRFQDLGYNCRRRAESNRGFKWSEESKKKLSEALKGKIVGVNHPMARLNDNIIKDILLTYLKSDLTNVQIAQDFGVSKTNINDIIRGKIWSHIQLDNVYDQDKLIELRSELQRLSDTKMIGRGIHHGMSKWTENDIMEIRRLVKSGVTQTAVAEKYGIKQGCVSNIVNHKIWKHLDWLQQGLYEWIRSDEFQAKAKQGVDVEFGVSTVYLMERLLISHVRVWHLEDKIRLTDDDGERSELKRQIDYINSKVRPRLICAIEDSLIKAYAEQDMTIISDGNLKHYGKEFEEGL